MPLLKKLNWKKITSENTNRASRDTNADKTTVLLSYLKNNYAFIVGQGWAINLARELLWEGRV